MGSSILNERTYFQEDAYIHKFIMGDIDFDKAISHIFKKQKV